MRKYYLRIISFYLCLILSFIGCQNSNTTLSHRFPLDENNYPKINTVSINGIDKEFGYTYGDIDSKYENMEFSGEISSEFKIVLPQALYSHIWIVDKNIEGAEFVDSTKLLPDENEMYDKEGQSPYLQEFTFEVKDKNAFKNICFKKVNLDLVTNSDGLLIDSIDYNSIDYIYQISIQLK